MVRVTICRRLKARKIEDLDGTRGRHNDVHAATCLRRNLLIMPVQRSFPGPGARPMSPPMQTGHAGPRELVGHSCWDLPRSKGQMQPQLRQ